MSSFKSVFPKSLRDALCILYPCRILRLPALRLGAFIRPLKPLRVLLARRTDVDYDMWHFRALRKPNETKKSRFVRL